ncbi:monovalent cation/H+ antiporter subunit D [Paracoccus sp. S-4012]|uniref:monovalent cation/H+ antiporter subunit D n=1 Tax=Paracoccus sp. S-4012 TaxID=2665648 RepID=UPI0012AFC87C|nr:monovalent cation/H+ antiporter subunit D [Paracoccus sp. S-4012]MRX51931.1 monovalent cation/H+ antiporter subunit D [Paracoccus sp. S-4012]
MMHLPVLPVVLPAVVAAVMVLAVPHDLITRRVLSVAGMVALTGLALAALMLPEPALYRLGDWPAPFGIILQLDRLAALMLMLAAVLGLAVVLYAIGTGWDRLGVHFHPLMAFQMMGLNGAFLTGDAFNLFVFFEVMLIASYGLMTHGGGGPRIKAGVQYVVVNLAGSAVFLFALGTIYAATGTLNMADIGVKAAAIEHDGLVRIGAGMLMVVFAIKAALVPLHIWLPATYERAPGPVAALFAVMTKVGVYAILRSLTLMFPAGTETGTALAEILRVTGGATLIVAMVGLYGARDFGRVITWSVIGSVGTLMLAMTFGQAGATAAGLYYLVHSTLAGAALFLLADLILTRRGTLTLARGPRLAQGGLIAALTMAAAVAMAGMPPLSGFLGKLMILEALWGQWGLWWLVIGTAILAIMGFARAGSTLFWQAEESDAPALPHPAQPLAFSAVAGLIAAQVLWTLAAGPVLGWLEDAAAALHDPAPLIRAVLS